MNIPWKSALAYLLVVLASVGSSVYATDQAQSRNDNLERQLERARVSALVLVCNQNEADRRIIVRVQRVEARANEAIAADPRTSDEAREIRKEQAEVQREAIEDLESRLDRIKCNEVK